MMRLMIAAAAVSIVASPALASHVTSPNGTVLENTEEMHEGFDNRGQCQAAFRQLRNDQRKSGVRGGEPYDSMGNGEYNNASRTTTQCEEIDGRYYVVFNANGI